LTDPCAANLHLALLLLFRKSIVMLQQSKFQPYLDFVHPFYRDRDAGHDFRHIVRIFGRLDELCRELEPPPSTRKLFFLAAFHGLGQKLSNDVEFRQSATHFLENLGWGKDESTESFISLDRHLSNPITIEEMIVHDANFFEVTGAFGIAKAFTVGGSYAQTYEQTLEIFEANLDKLEFRTPVGRKDYEPRKEAARAFIANLRSDLAYRDERGVTLEN